tara:strand:- start:147 stop:680 length:534 start_codon:yes stop_codon:yes gene_type:complete
MDYIIHDDFFENPDNIRKEALSKKFYTKENHPYDIFSFPGYRTDYFNDIDSQFYNTIHDKIIPHVSKLENVKHPSEKYKDFNLQISFSYTLKGALSLRHTDDILEGYKVKYGGLVYLNPDPPKKSGTTLYLNETTYLDNIYNRFVLYNSNIEHEPTDNFGTDINNSRLVLTIFYDMA